LAIALIVHHSHDYRRTMQYTKSAQWSFSYDANQALQLTAAFNATTGLFLYFNFHLIFDKLF